MVVYGILIFARKTWRELAFKSGKIEEVKVGRKKRKYLFLFFKAKKPVSLTQKNRQAFCYLALNLQTLRRQAGPSRGINERASVAMSS